MADAEEDALQIKLVVVGDGTLFIHLMIFIQLCTLKGAIGKYAKNINSHMLIVFSFNHKDMPTNWL